MFTQNLETRLGFECIVNVLFPHLGQIAYSVSLVSRYVSDMGFINCIVVEDLN